VPLWQSTWPPYMEVNRRNTSSTEICTFERNISCSLHQTIEFCPETDFSKNTFAVIYLFIFFFFALNSPSLFSEAKCICISWWKKCPQKYNKHCIQQIYSMGWIPDFPPYASRLYAGLNFLISLWIWRTDYVGDIDDFSVQPRRKTLIAIVCDQPSSGDRRSFGIWWWTEWSGPEHISGDGDKWAWNNGGTMKNRRKSKKVEENLLPCHLAFEEYHMNSLRIEPETLRWEAGI